MNYNNNQRDKYKNSINKQKAYYEYKSDKVILLDGDIVEFKGIKFGGAMSWYDASYLTPQGYKYINTVGIWTETMNDTNYIKGYKDFYEIFEQEKPKIEDILDADIIITHVCPLNHNRAFQEEFRGLKSNLFYCFNGEDYLKQTNAKYWIYDHSHGQHSIEVYNTTCILNSLGYPGEIGFKKMNIEI